MKSTVHYGTTNQAYIRRNINYVLATFLKWNLDLPKAQWTGQIKRGFVVSRFFSICLAVTGAENIVRYMENFII